MAPNSELSDYKYLLVINDMISTLYPTSYPCSPKGRVVVFDRSFLVVITLSLPL